MIRLGSSVLDPESGEVSRGVETATLGRRTLGLMLCLIESHGRLVTSEELLKQVWPGLVVEANTVQVHISLIRKALGPDRGCLKTLSGRGYRLELDPPGIGKNMGTGDTDLSNLPYRTDRIIGREQDIAAVQEALSRSRLVSLVGSGGVGKTRLALEVGSQLRDHFAEGVWLVDFAAVRDAKLVVIAVASTLGISIGNESLALRDLVASLATTQRLLVFDNCEYQSRAVGTVVKALLLGAPNISILATSQEPLDILGEHLFPLKPLSFPAKSESDVTKFSAVTLFIERAQSRNPFFSLTEDNASQIAQICRRIEGVPLAIEMAVGRLPVLGVKGLADSIDDQLPFLRSSSQVKEFRHSSLRAMVDWSIGLLSEDEASLFFRLGIFPAGFSIEAATSVAAFSEKSGGNILDFLGRLVNKSLLVVVQEDPPRFRLLETLRLFALERLSQLGESDKAAERLGRWLIERFRNANLEWDFISDEKWSSRYVNDLDDVRAIISWGFGRPEFVPLAVELVSVTARMFRVIYHKLEGQGYLDQATFVSKHSVHALTRAELLLEQAEYRKVDSPAKALAYADEALSIYRKHSNNLYLARLLLIKALLLSRLGENSYAARDLAEAEDLVIGLDLPKALTNLFFNRASHAKEQEQYDDSRKYFMKALSEARRLKDGLRESAILVNLGDLECRVGELDMAISVTRDALRKLDPFSQSDHRCIALINLAGYALVKQHLSEAALALDDALLISKAGAEIPRRTREMVLTICASLSIHGENFYPAATLIGFLDPSFEADSAGVHDPEVRLIFNSTVATLKSRLTGQDFRTYRGLGATYPESEAIRIALDEIVEPVLVSNQEAGGHTRLTNSSQSAH